MRLIPTSRQTPVGKSWYQEVQRGKPASHGDWRRSVASSAGACAGDGFGVRQGVARGRVSPVLHVVRSEGVAADAAVRLL